MATPTIQEYNELCRTLFETVSACTPDLLIGGVIAADLAAQIVSLQDLVYERMGSPADAARTAWLACFHTRFLELQEERRRKAAEEAAAAPEPFTATEE